MDTLFLSSALKGATVVVPGRDAFRDCMGTLTAGCETVAIEKDPVQLRHTTDIIPTLRPVNQADLVTPLEELNSRL